LVTIDTAEYLLDKFGDKNWRLIDEQLVRGEVTFEESLVKEFLMLKVSEKVMLKALNPITRFRPNFEKLIEYCKQQGFPLIVVSGGLDFSIRHFLGQKGWLNSVQIFAPKAKCTKHGVVLSFPKRFDQTSTNFKEDLVKHYKNQGKKVVYIGNGWGDYSAAKAADWRMAIDGSQLCQMCKSSELVCERITDFQQAVDSIRNWIDIAERKN
jgi:2-hydroxy-3-keto-5-methylthiopentenyl-1-phosphate phosphatase